MNAREYGHQHGEAFCLMKYATEDSSEVEWLWNSRDGVTPFCITSRSGKEMRHVQWQLDQCAPRYQPLPGERIFVDVTPEIARGWAEGNVERYWDEGEYPMRDMFPTKEQAIATLTAEYAKPGQPAVIEAKDWQRPAPRAPKGRFA